MGHRDVDSNGKRQTWGVEHPFWAEHVVTLVLLNMEIESLGWQKASKVFT